MSCEVKLHPSALAELQALDGRLRLLVAKQLLKLQENPLAGKELGNRAGIDLTGYRKLYLDNKRIRIVYQYRQEILIVFVVSIGKNPSLLRATLLTKGKTTDEIANLPFCIPAIEFLNLFTSYKITCIQQVDPHICMNF